MTLNLHAPETEEQLQPRITVVGVGGAGGNAVNNMIQSNLEGVEFLVCNTDAQSLTQSQCGNRLQLGRSLTRGLGGGSRPDIGRAAAEEEIEEIAEATGNSDMLFIAAGMGGATGTGAAPVIARTAREKGILTVAVVTKPFHFEGVHRMRIAEQGIQELAQEVDTLIIIPNQNLFRIANEKTTFADAFKLADEVLYSGVRGVTDLVVKPGLINLDFADIRSVMTEMGKAMMGTGEAEGENRAVAAAEAAISNPLLDDVSMQGARGVLINITGGPDLTLFEVDEAANRIRDEVDSDANIIFGSTYDPSLEGQMRISVVATGIEAEEKRKDQPVTLSLVTDNGGQQQPAAAAPPRGALGAHANAQHNGGPAPAAGATAAQPAAAPAQASAQGQPRMGAAGATAAATAYDIADEPAPQVRAQTQAAAETPRETAATPEREETFVAPEPVQPPRRSDYGIGEARSRTAARQAAESPGPADSEQAAPETAPSGRGRGRSRAGSLFSRVTGSGRALQGGSRESPRPAGRDSEEPRLGTAAAQPEAGEPSRAQTQAPPEREEPVSQSRLPGLDPMAHTGDRSLDDDQLDIPAFLRRQAN